MTPCRCPSPRASGSNRVRSRGRRESHAPRTAGTNITHDNPMKYILVLSFAFHAALAQIGATRAGSIAGTVLDAKTLKPVPAALVIASRAGNPPVAKHTKSGGDGAFQVQGLATGNYSLCVQAAGDQYLDPCQW